MFVSHILLHFSDCKFGREQRGYFNRHGPPWVSEMFCQSLRCDNLLMSTSLIFSFNGAIETRNCLNRFYETKSFVPPHPEVVGHFTYSARRRFVKVGHFTRSPVLYFQRMFVELLHEARHPNLQSYHSDPIVTH